MIRSLATLFLLASCQPSYAQDPSPCAPRDMVADVLTGRFGENPVSLGLTDSGLMEMWANPETGTWTITITSPEGLACGMMDGGSFEALPQGKPT